MPTPPGRTALAFKDTKMVALCFDYVVPISLRDLTGKNIESELKNILGNLLHPSMLEQSHPSGIKEEVIQFYSLLNQTSYLSYLATFDDEAFAHLSNELVAPLDKWFNKLINKIEEQIFETVGLPDVNSSNTDTEDHSLIITGLKMVDASKLSWEHILNIRKDKESRRKLFNLREFIYEDFRGKPLSYVEDKLGYKTEDFDQTVKKLGLEAEEARHEVICSNKSFMSLTLMGLLSALQPGLLATPVGVAAGLGAVVGSIFSLGKIKLEVGKTQRALQEFRLNDPVSYLIDIRNSANKPKDD